MITPDRSITIDQVKAEAALYGIDQLALRAVMRVECGGKGFDDKGNPIILFERHIFWQQLHLHGLGNVATNAYKERPDLCNPAPTPKGGYGPIGVQQGRLTAATLYDRTSALESASYGIGQVMGNNWRGLGYTSLQAFVNAMWKDEASQLDAMLRYIKSRGLIAALNGHDWATFAAGYNGAGYAKFSYDEHLAQAFHTLGGG